MRTRPRLHRLLATLTSAWFALYVAVAPVALPCPMHHDAGGAVSAPVGDAHDAHAGHAMPATDGPSDESPAPVHPCDCTTDCCGVPVASLPRAATVATIALTAPRTDAPFAPPMVRAASRTRLLPFAHGPPA